jgi:hypothetical protein
MQLGFEKLMSSYDIELTDLDDDVQTGIKQLETLKKSVESKRRIGQEITPETLKKIKFLDSSIIREILDYIEENDLEEGSEEEEEDDNDFSDDNNDNEEEEEESDEDENEYDMNLGDLLDQEFTAMKKSGKTEFSMDYLRSNSPSIYQVIWDNYDDGEENGIQTSNFTFTETEIGSQKFKLN